MLIAGLDCSSSQVDTLHAVEMENSQKLDR
jgi:hypothetical protein